MPNRVIAIGDIHGCAVALRTLLEAIAPKSDDLFVSLGECLTERSGRINLGLEGTLVFGAMSGYAIAYETGSPWFGVLAAAFAGMLFGLFHGWICKLPKVNDIAIGIALMLLGMGLAFFFGKPYIQPVAPDLPAIEFGWWSDIPQVQAALRVNVLFLLGAVLAVALWFMFRATRVGLVVRVVGDSTDAALPFPRDTAALKGKEVRLRVDMQQASLFSYWFA